MRKPQNWGRLSVRALGACTMAFVLTGLSQGQAGNSDEENGTEVSEHESVIDILIEWLEEWFDVEPGQPEQPPAEGDTW